MTDFEQWTRSEIVRLRTQAETATAEADALQRTFDRWKRSQDSDMVRAQSEQATSQKHDYNGSKPHPRAKKSSYGSKASIALAKIRENSPAGLTTDELHAMFVEMFGAEYKRASLRSLLWIQRDQGKIESRDGRHMIVDKTLDAA